MLKGFKTIIIKNSTQPVPRAVFGRGALIINKSAVGQISKSGYAEIGVNTKTAQICICESGKNSASIPIKTKTARRFISKDFIGLIAKFVQDYEEDKRYSVPVEAGDGYLILSFGKAEVLEEI